MAPGAGAGESSLRGEAAFLALSVRWRVRRWGELEEVVSE